MKETLEKNYANDIKIKYQNTKDILNDVCGIIDSAREYAYQSVNIALIQRNWLIGYRIAEEELKGKDRADYGIEVIKKLAKDLTKLYGKGFDRINLYYYLRFYKNFPQIVDSVSRQSKKIISWTHYRILLQVENKEVRDWYEKEAYEQNWSVRTLQRNIDSQYYYRLLKSQLKEPVINEMKEKTKENEIRKCLKKF